VIETMGRARPLSFLPEIDDVTRREFLIGAASLLLLPAGCGSGGEGGEETASGETRTVRHALGETEVPVSPERVVGLSTAELADTLLALGVEPVGMTTYGDNPADDPEAWPDAIRERAIEADIASVGVNAQPDLEKVAALEPDLILGLSFDRGIYDRLSEIAPTVLFPDGLGWEALLKRTAEALGAQREAERVLAGHDERVGRVRPKVEGALASIVRPQPGEILLHGPASAPGAVLEELGIEVQDVPETAEDWSGDGSIGSMSPELVPEIDGEHVFVITYGLEETTFEELIERPLWRQLPAAREGRVHPVEGFAWTNHGPFGVLRMISEVEEALAR